MWAAVSGNGGAAGVLFGGLLTEGPGWRWVLFINIPFSAVALLGRLRPCSAVSAYAPAGWSNFDALGAFLVTGGMLLLVYTLVSVLDVGWAPGAQGRRARRLPGVLLAGFLFNELRVRNPLVPLSILKSQGSRRRRRDPARGDRRLPTNVLLPHALHADRAALLADPDRRRLPAADRWLSSSRRASARSSSRASARSRSSWLGTVTLAAGLYWLSRIPVHGPH